MKIATVIVSFLLTLTILSNSLRVSFTYAYYYLDTSGFIERLCVNKDKPEMHCNGKCHLKKVVEDDNGANDDIPFKDINFKEITLFVVDQIAYKLFLPSLKKQELLDYNNLYVYAFIYAFDHPPQV